MNSVTLSPSAQVSTQSWQILQEIVSENGARPAGSSSERQLLHDFTNRYWSQSTGVPVNSQPVTFTVRGSKKRSAIIVASKARIIQTVFVSLGSLSGLPPPPTQNGGLGGL